ncbi:MAG: ELWxxDGT repeat protein [Bacteroidales bacterium]
MKTGLSLCMMAFACCTITGQNAELLKDINPGTGSSFISYMTQLGDKVIFQAIVPGADSGPWVTDGTADGTFLLKKMIGQSGKMTVFKNLVYFSGDDGIHGQELWQTDGTIEGTIMVKDIFPGSYGSKPAELTVFNDALFFSGNHPDYGEELYVLHVTDNETVIGIYDITEGPESTKPGWLYPAYGKLYFVGRDNRYLYYHDPTKGITGIYNDGVKPGPTGNPYFAEYNCSVYFPAIEADIFEAKLGVQLWKVLTDGYVVRLTEIFSDNVDLKPRHLTRVGDKLFFSGSTASFGDELCVYTGEVYAPGITYMVKNINPSGDGNLGGFITAFKDRLIFSAGDATTGVELWVSDGTESGTKLIRDIYPGPVSSGIVSPVIIGDTLYFSADDGTGGELWRLINPDGQPEKFTNITDGGAWGPELVRIGKTFIFSASNKATGTELWKMTVSGSTATESLESAAIALKVFPNPAFRTFTVEIPECISLPCEMSICSMTGAPLEIWKVTDRMVTVELEENSELHPGLYIIKSDDGRKTAFTKLLIR